MLGADCFDISFVNTSSLAYSFVLATSLARRQNLKRQTEKKRIVIIHIENRFNTCWLDQAFKAASVKDTRTRIACKNLTRQIKKHQSCFGLGSITSLV